MVQLWIAIVGYISFFVFGIMCGIKLYNHFHIVHIDIESKNLTDEEVNSLLTKKWIEPVMQSIDNDVEQVVMKLANGLQTLRDKFEHSMPEIDNEISELEESLYYMLEDLCGSERDMEAVAMFRKELFHHK